MRNPLSLGQQKAIASLSTIRVNEKLRKQLDYLLPIVEEEGITEGDMHFLYKVIEDHRNQIINPDMHLMSLECGKNNHIQRTPVSMSSIYYMILIYNEKKEVFLSGVDIAQKANKFFDTDVTLKFRGRETITAKQMAMKWMKEQGMSLSEIRKVLNLDCHSTVISGIRRINGLISQDVELFNTWTKFINS